MTIIAPVLVGGVWKPSSPPPQDFMEGWFDGTNFHFPTPADYFADVPAYPRGSITEVFDGSVVVPTNYFGYHVSNHEGLVAPPLAGAGIIRLHDSTYGSAGTASGRTRWSKINYANGSYDWSALDAVVDFWYSRGYELIYTLSPTPTWASARPAEAASYELGSAAEPSNNTYWTTWCTAVATRYDGKIKYWELWNEPNLSGFYSGTQAKMAELARLAHGAIKTVNAANVILSPSPTSLASGGATWFDGFLTASDGAAGTGKDWFDVVACHLYISSPVLGDSADTLVNAIKSVLATRSVSKPLWNTETGVLSPDLKSLAPPHQLRQLKRSMLIAAALGVQHYNFYTYNHSTLGIDHDPALVAELNAFVASLQGATITRVNRLADKRLAVVINGAQVFI